MTRAFLIGLAALSVYIPVAHAQSTARVGEVSHPLRVEVSVGMDRPHGYGGEGGTVTSAAVALRYVTSSVGVRATVHGIRRQVDDVSLYGFGDRDSLEIEHRVLALTLDTDVSWRIWRDLILSPSAGAGFSPYAYGRQSTIRVRATPDPTRSDVGNYSRSDVGVVWTLGLALRFRHFVVEKKAIGLLGPESAIPRGREYYPWTIGYRF